MLPILPIVLIGSAIYAAGINFYKKKNNEYERSELSTELATQAQALSTEEKLNRDLIWSSAALTLTTMGLMGFPWLTLASIPIEIYLFLPFIKRGYRELVEKKTIGVSVLDAVISIVMLLLGYFFASALFFVFYNSSQKLLLKTQQKSRKSLVNILGEKKQFVWLLKEGVEIEVPFESIKKDDVLVIQAGEMIAVDGSIVDGIANIDQHILTGESQPVTKTVGDAVFAGTFLLSGKIFVRVDKESKDTVAEQIAAFLNNTADFKSSLETKGELLANQGALPTLLIAAVTLPILGATSAATVLLASFGYNMRIIAPISVLNALKITSGNGILVKDGRALESLSKIDTVVFDKTGTLTEEQPSVGQIHITSTYSENEVLSFAACAEYKQTHPIAKAILQEAQQRELSLQEIENASYEVGFGIRVNAGKQVILVGSFRFIEMEGVIIPTEMHDIQVTCHEKGYSLIYVAIDGKLVGMIELRPTLRPHIRDIITQLHNRKLKTYVLSGDNQEPTKYLAKQLGIDDYFAEVLALEKAALIATLKKQGKTVCFIGDGINDAIALKEADVSISLRGASSIATDTAQIVFMEGDLSKLPWIFEFSDKLDSNLQRGLALTIIPGVICVAGIYLFNFGVITGTILYNLGLAAGVTNAMFLKHKGSGSYPLKPGHPSQSKGYE